MSDKSNLGFPVLLIAMLVIFLFWVAIPKRYEVNGRRYLCWAIPGGEDCVEVFHR